eukprot:2078862-Pleurochrysis_carterae.AAC.1
MVLVERHRLVHAIARQPWVRASLRAVPRQTFPQLAHEHLSLAALNWCDTVELVRLENHGIAPFELVGLESAVCL